MDFKTVLSQLLKAFERHNIRYALMGGLALGAWGVVRATVDIDFLVHRDDMEKVDLIMKEMGYECKYRSENVSQYLSPLKIFGEIDFLHAFRTPSLGMLERTEEKRIFDDITIKVLSIEDLIGFKLQAIKNDESRKNMDLADIEALIAFNREIINWTLVKEYFELFGFEELFNHLRSKYGN